MQKGICIIALMISSCFLMAELPEKVGALSSKVILKNQSGYFVLSDGSCWKVVPFSKRWRSLSEWWKDVELVPERYTAVPDDWFLGVEVEAYLKYDHLEVDEANASNRKMLKKCTHLLVNSKTRQVLFAIALDMTDCIVQVFQDAYEDGYNKGYDKGYDKGKFSGDSLVTKAQLRDEYDKGYKEGYDRALIDRIMR